MDHTNNHKYLVLHGYRQSQDIIRKKIKGLFPKIGDLIIPHGPLLVEPELYGWFQLRDGTKSHPQQNL